MGNDQSHTPESVAQAFQAASLSRGLALIPAYNEGERAAKVVSAARHYLPVLVVDDGSTDSTAAAAEGAGAQVLRQNPNQGKGAALQAGFRFALAGGYDYVVTLDADGQHDPAHIPAFQEAFLNSRADLVIGQRDFSRMPFIRQMSNTLGKQIFSWAVGQPIPDNQSGYRLISRPLMERMLAPGERGFAFEVDMITACIGDRGVIAWVPITTIYADENSHIRPLQHAYKFIQVSLRARKALKRSAR